MTIPLIRVDHLSKVFRVPEREPGLKAAMRALFHRTYRQVCAVQDISFTIGEGEIVGLIGPNGAGKTTTLKILAGLLYPTSGEVTLAGYIPWQRRAAFLNQIGMVQGNKSQLLWDIPAMDSYHVLSEIYRIPMRQFKETLDELVRLLQMEDLLTRPIRNLSLGERMKCELVAGLLHRPKVLFLDEPTLGLDVTTQNRLRLFIAEYNRRFGACILLTSHYMADVEQLCPRVILIHNGQLLHDGALQGLAERMAPFKLIRVTLDGGVAINRGLPQLPEGAELLERNENHLILRCSRSAAPVVTSCLLSACPVTDLTVEDPPIEAVIDQVYREGIA
ncbi:MAG TPA: ATP-binding cassette domain-containing protein [Anaerolineaceae bacterium]